MQHVERGLVRIYTVGSGTRDYPIDSADWRLVELAPADYRCPQCGFVTRPIVDPVQYPPTHMHTGPGGTTIAILMERQSVSRTVTPSGLPTDKKFEIHVDGVRVATDREIVEHDTGVLLSLTKAIRRFVEKTGERPDRLLISEDGSCEAFRPDDDRGIPLAIDWSDWHKAARS